MLMRRCGSGLRLVLDGTGINSFSVARDGLVVELVSGNFYQHKAAVAVERPFHIFRCPEVVPHELAGVSQNEIVDVVLRLHPFGYVLMTREDHIYAVALKKRKQLRAEVHVCTVMFSVRKKRMVEVADLPFGL